VALVSALAAEHVKVALCGDGGDELFGGYPTYTASQLVGTYHRVPAPARAAARALAAHLPVSHGKVGWAEKARRFLAAAHRPPAAAHLYWRQYYSPAERARLLGRPAAPHVPVALERLLGPSVAETAGFPGVDRYLALDAVNYLPSDMLCKVDVASMMYSLEARVPLLDHELVELAFSLPPGVKRRAWQGKRVLRAALAGLVPSAILRARKQGFNVPIAAWLAGPLRRQAGEVLRPGGARAMDLVDPAVVARLWAEHERRQADHSYRLWTLLIFALWYEGLTPTGDAEYQQPPSYAAAVAP
jgi:asparagine synthase (glutamine-hydrolysing)